MPTFAMAPRDLNWLHHAPVIVRDTFVVPAPPDQVFERIADLGGWAQWHKGVRKVRLDDGPATGLGAVRTVWVGPSSFHERFIAWAPGERLTFTMLGSNLPGMVGMVEDWELTAQPSTGSTVVASTIALDTRAALRPLHRALRAVIAQGMKGGAGLADEFPLPAKAS
jgi:uncharacterized protein YndB with AHSA1/START domain